MDSASESAVESDDILRTSTRRMTVLIVSMTVLVVAIFVISMLLFVDVGNTPLEVREELTQWEYPSYDMEERRVLEEANEQMARMELGNIQQVDPDSSNYKARLFRDNNWGILFWEFKDWDTEIWVNADTGEIFYYFSTADREDGPRISREDIEAYVEELMSQFAPLPSDMDPPWVDHSSWTSEGILLPNGTWGSIEYYSDWDFQYNRTYDSIRTSDGITVWMDVDGSLTWYNKDWFMDLEGFDTTFTVTADEAEEAAAAFLIRERGMQNVTFDYCVKRIMWPFEMEDWPRPGEDPVLVWSLQCNRHHLDGRLHWLTVSCTGSAEVLSYASAVLS